MSQNSQFYFVLSASTLSKQTAPITLQLLQCRLRSFAFYLFQQTFFHTVHILRSLLLFAEQMCMNFKFHVQSSLISHHLPLSSSANSHPDCHFDCQTYIFSLVQMQLLNGVLGFTKTTSQILFFLICVCIKLHKKDILLNIPPILTSASVWAPELCSDLLWWKSKRTSAAFLCAHKYEAERLFQMYGGLSQRS